MRTLEFEIPDDFAERLAETEDGDLSRAAQVGLKFVVAIAGADAYRRFLELAKVEGVGKAAMFDKIMTAYLTPADELRPIDRATDSQKTAYNRLSATAKAARRERDTTILQMATEGITRASIAETVGLSTIRVNQIVADYKAQNKSLDTQV
jgi:hypothetical protein